MKKACKIEVKSTRRFTFGDAPFPMEVQDIQELWEELPHEEEIPEELLFSVPSDRVGSAPMNQPEPPAPSDSTLTAYGIFSREKDGSFRASYEDSEITGLPGCLTTFCLSPTGALILLRRGEVKTCMIFEEGKRHLCDYGAEGGVPSVFLHTHAVKAQLSEKGGSVYVDYSVEIRGALAERNEIFVSIRI